MPNFYFKNSFYLTLIIFTLLFVSSSRAFAQTAPSLCSAEEAAKKTACEKPAPATTGQITADELAEESLANRNKCDEATLALDQCNLKTIREEEDVKKAAELCISEYAPEENGSQSGTSAGMYVPVHETGELLTLTQSTNKLTTNIDEFSGKSYFMSIKLCMYLHAIKRVQYALEDLAFVKEPDMRRQAATKIEEYKEGLLGKQGLIQTGYSPSGEITEPDQPGAGNAGGESLYPKNLKTYVDNNIEEASGLTYDRINKSTNNFKNEVVAKLKIDNIVQAQGPFNSTISKKDYEDFTQNNKNLSSDDFWGIFREVFNPDRPNNPNNAYFLAQNQNELAQSQARDLALKEYSAGGGFLPTRKCVTFSSDGKYCSEWKTDTPGAIIARTAGDALGAKLEQYLDPALGKIGEGNEPVTTEAETFSPSSGAGGGSTGDNNEIPNQPNPDNPDPNDPNQPAPPPILYFSAYNLTNNTRLISWDTANVSSCSTKNDWLGTTNNTPSHLVTVIKSRGQSLPARAVNEIIFPLPLNFTASWSKNGDPYSQTNMATTTNSLRTSIVYNWNVPTPSKNTDIYYLNIKDGTNLEGTTIGIGGTNFPITPLTGKRVVEMFKNYQTANPNAAVYRRYKFTYGTTTANIKIELIEPKYEITCVGRDGSTVSDSTN